MSRMTKDIQDWVQRVHIARPVMIELAKRLQQPGVTVGLNEELKNLCSSIPFVAVFTYEGEATAHICFQLLDHQTDSDVVITNMTTLPQTACRRGFGSRAVQTLLTWARENGLKEILATQVADPDSKKFWEKNGFVRCPDPNPCGDYIHVLS